MIDTSQIPESETGRKRAPGDLLLVQAFLNTVDFEAEEETFSDPGGLAGWLIDHGLLHEGAEVREADVRLAVAVREALRSLAHANDEAGPPDPAALETLNRVAGGARLRLRFAPDGSAGLTPDPPGAEGAIALLLGIVYTAIADGTWDRFKACRRDTCRWAFYDRSRNRSSHWCQMAVCGNREKARAYRERQKGEA